MSQNILFEEIAADIKNNDIVLYMKGTKEMPQCGFSSAISGLLTHLDVPFKAVNTLDNPEMRQGIKDYTDWPTIPQLYIKGEFIGGYDIVKEMHEKGELQDFLKEKGLLAAA
jgi:monothiol glutaredoxin